MVQRLIAHELPLLAVGLLQIDYQYRKHTHADRVTKAVRRVDVATQRLDVAKLQTLACNPRTRSTSTTGTAGCV
jgi:7-cyano-7-deazaguanine synthase in queuosine biosynthesis